ncbi:amino acid ABC transporter permease [Alicyclobacillus acidiphilus]|uniref:amino acid ABC transporter permease n=1 Tax=Alicyclobacillus acidiphilus TaxID=182455 RepID=UPI0008301233|nr:amino acid ABC transporter permease [Alicyclobacillus acidiphilus]
MAPFDVTYIFLFIPKLLSTIGVTFVIVGGAIVIGVIVGVIVALPRLYHVPVVKRISQVYVSFFRGTPILIQLFLIYYGLPELVQGLGINLSKVPVLYFVVFTYGLNNAAFFSETIRASVTAVDRGQVEAGYSIGMTGWQSLRRIVLPQALGIAVPVAANLVIALLKDTSLAFSLGVMELTGKAQSLGTITQHFIEAYVALAVIYLGVSIALEKLFGVWERRLLRYDLANHRLRDALLWRRASFRRGGDAIGMGKEEMSA